MGLGFPHSRDWGLADFRMETIHVNLQITRLDVCSSINLFSGLDSKLGDSDV